MIERFPLNIMRASTQFGKDRITGVYNSAWQILLTHSLFVEGRKGGKGQGHEGEIPSERSELHKWTPNRTSLNSKRAEQSKLYRTSKGRVLGIEVSKQDSPEVEVHGPALKEEAEDSGGWNFKSWVRKVHVGISRWASPPPWHITPTHIFFLGESTVLFFPPHSLLSYLLFSSTAKPCFDNILKTTWGFLFETFVSHSLLLPHSYVIELPSGWAFTAIHCHSRLHTIYYPCDT